MAVQCQAMMSTFKRSQRLAVLRCSAQGAKRATDLCSHPKEACSPQVAAVGCVMLSKAAIGKGQEAAETQVKSLWAT